MRLRAARTRSSGLCLRPTTRGSRLRATGACSSPRSGTRSARLRRELARRPGPRRVPRRPRPRDRRACCLHRTLTACTHPRRRRSVSRPAARDVSSRCDRGGNRRLVVFLPERVAHGRAVARAGHPRPSRRIARRRDRRRARLSGRVRLGSSRDPLGHRHRGAREGGRARARLDRIEMPNADPRFVEVLAAIVRNALEPVAA